MFILVKVLVVASFALLFPCFVLLLLLAVFASSALVDAEVDPTVVASPEDEEVSTAAVPTAPPVPSSCILGILAEWTDPPLDVVLRNDFERMLLPPMDRILAEEEVVAIIAEDKVEVVNPWRG